MIQSLHTNMFMKANNKKETIMVSIRIDPKKIEDLRKLFGPLGQHLKKSNLIQAAIYNFLETKQQQHST